MGVKDGGADWSLIAVLLEGPYETPLWGNFLEQLRCRTQSDYATLLLHPPGKPFGDALHLVAGPAQPDAVERMYRAYFAKGDSPPTFRLAEGRPHTLEDMFGSDGSLHRDYYRELVSSNGITAARQMRIREASGVDALLSLARRGAEFPASVDALLLALVPSLRAVLRLYVERERERFAASLTADAVRRLQFGWITLDRNGHILECDDQGEAILAQSRALRRDNVGRIAAELPGIQREIYGALGHIVENPGGRARAITLSRDPWLDMLLMPARSKAMSAMAAPIAIAYVHSDSWHSQDRREQLAELFALSRRESQLALALSSGMTLHEAATEFGYKLETARTYSKAIYAKTGARGMPDLVRIIMRSVLSVAP